MASYPNFLGGSNQLASLRADCEKTVNCFFSDSDTPGGLPALYSIPGQRPFVTISGDSDVRALFSMNGRTLGVVGTTLVELFAGGTFAVLGSVLKNSNPAQITMNGVGGNQALIASGNNAYSLNLATNVLSAAVLTGEAQQIGMLDGYGLALNPLTGKLRLSDLNDFGTWDPTQFALRSSAPDSWRALLVNAPDIWLIGEQTGDIWFDAGTSPFPFAPRPGATFKYGIAAVFSLAAIGDAVMWLAQDANGIGSVVLARGYVPQPVSSYALETAVARYARESRIDDAEALACEFRGHQFYVLSFPSANATWAYDVRTGLWIELGTWNAPMNRFDIWHPRVLCQAFGKQLVGGNDDGVIAELDETYIAEADGSELRRVRIPPSLVSRDGVPLVVDRFELECDAGVGIVSGQGVNPLASLRISKDFAHTFSNVRAASIGRMGEYGKRCVWTRNGSSNVGWVPEIVLSDPVPFRITGASIQGSGFGR